MNDLGKWQRQPHRSFNCISDLLEIIGEVVVVTSCVRGAADPKSTCSLLPSIGASERQALSSIVADVSSRSARSSESASANKMQVLID